jgi:alpha-beta hydrolase superfamily lysophospholipase
MILTDEMGLHEYAEKKFGREGLKYILYGHSMGSFVVRSIFSTPRYSKQFDGFVFASTAGPNGAVGLGKFLAGTTCLFGGAKKKSRFLSLMAFGTYTKRIKDAKTSYDWLSTDPKEVQKYIDDPMCGFYFTGEGFRTLFNLISFMQSKEAYALIPDRPCFFTYGDDDHVGSYGGGVKKVIARMKESGANLKAKSYGPYRHEIQNEPVREEYFKDLIDFFDSVPLA